MLSVLWVHNEKILPWFCDRYIQLQMRKDSSVVNFYDSLIEHRECPFFVVQLVDRESILDLFNNFSDFLEFHINHDYYINLFLNTSNLYSNIKREFWHPAFIYGYNQEQDEIHICDFIQQRKYASEIVIYENVNKSFVGKPETDIFSTFNNSIAYKYRDYDYQINLELLKISLSDFINAKDSFIRQQRYFINRNMEFVYGMQIYTCLSEYCEKSDVFDVRAFHVLFDHKVAMKIRLKYLFNNKIISTEKFKELKKINEYILSNALILRNMVIKYMISKNNTKRCILDKLRYLSIIDKTLHIKLIEAI